MVWAERARTRTAEVTTRPDPEPAAMPSTFPCPNPACDQVFSTDAVKGARELVCPLCRTVFQFRAEGAAPAAPAKPAAPVKAAWPAAPQAAAPAKPAAPAKAPAPAPPAKPAAPPARAAREAPPRPAAPARPAP